MHKEESYHNERVDVIGEAILRQYCENSPCQIALRIDGEEEEPMSSAYFFRQESEMNTAEREALKLSKGRVLDVGAGAGCHSLILQKLGLSVVALERSAAACIVLRGRGVKEVVQSDIMDYSQGSFDTVLLLMNGFGMAGNEQGVVSLLMHVKQLLAPGGKIIGDSTDIRYFKQESDELDLSQGHFSEVQFEVSMDGFSERFPWIYPDEFLLEALAEEAGLQYRTIMYSDEYHFLCELYV
jgi:SAM-dependent methyltransferase